MHGWAPLQVLHGDSDILFPVSGVGSCSPADATLGSLENGTGPEDHVLPEPGLGVEASSPGQGSPLSSLLPSASVPESMTINELRQAIVAMMNRKDELEEEHRSLRNLLDGEMEHSAALRQEVDTLKKKLAEQEERHGMKVQALARGGEAQEVVSEGEKKFTIEKGKDILKLPLEDCHYAVYATTYDAKESKKEGPVFIFLGPESASLKSKMIYASSKGTIKKKLTGIKHKLQANC
ncbi:sorting nexin-29-like [Otolemur garnettii]|uniref:sorting nexin-29-like n=1 Tax=Otolemur garnettii TaxID=30611 RepID=UPI000C7EA3F8|nr:sorting nexin-29-like [Otolemur garnettii]